MSLLSCERSPGHKKCMPKMFSFAIVAGQGLDISKGERGCGTEIGYRVGAEGV